LSASLPVPPTWTLQIQIADVLHIFGMKSLAVRHQGCGDHECIVDGQTMALGKPQSAVVLLDRQRLDRTDRTDLGQKLRISIRDMRSLREATATNSFNTWTFTVPPAASSSSALSAFAVSADNRWSDVGVEKVFTPAHCRARPNLKSGGSRPLYLRIRANRSRAPGLFATKGSVALDVDFDLVRGLQIGRLHNRGRKAERSSCYPHSRLHLPP
jgi:hypothetical protein